MFQSTIVKSSHAGKFLTDLQLKSDRVLNYFLIGLFIAGIVFAAVCQTWLLTVGCAGLLLLAYQFKKMSDKNILLSQKIGKLEIEIQQKDTLQAFNLVLGNRLKEKSLQLEISNNELESFSYSVSHDLRAPLRIINGYGKLLLKNNKDKLDTRGQEDLQVIMDNAAHMGNLIDGLVSFSRLGRTTIDRSAINMTEMVKAVIADIKDATNTHAEIRLNDFEPTVCDPALMKQVWLNLVSNAVKYSLKKEHPIIEIGSTVYNGRQTFYIKDNGVGFDMEHADKLFAVFQRLHKVTEYEGTGVGLSLAQRIINKHGGKIWAEGKVDGGATFYFTLTD